MDSSRPKEGRCECDIVIVRVRRKEENKIKIVHWRKILRLRGRLPKKCAQMKLSNGVRDKKTKKCSFEGCANQVA